MSGVIEGITHGNADRAMVYGAVDEGGYSPTLLPYHYLLRRFPLVNACVEARVQAAVASWSMSGRDSERCQKKFEGVTGRGNETFQDVVQNLLTQTLLCGDSFATIEDNPFNLKVHASDEVTIHVKNHKIDHYMLSHDTRKIPPQRMLHISKGRVGAMVHGQSSLSPIAQFAMAHRDVIQVELETISRKIRPGLLIYATPEPSDENETGFEKLRETFKTYDQQGSTEMFVSPDTVERVEKIGVSEGQTVNSLPILQYFDKLIMNVMRCSEIILGTGTVNSEETARHQFTGFRQAVRFDQQLLERNIKNKVLRKLCAGNTPDINFSYATEPEEEAFARNMQAAQTIAGLDLPKNLKTAAILDRFEEAGLIEHGTTRKFSNSAGADPGAAASAQESPDDRRGNRQIDSRT